ncbi:MAG: Smr/MutS family protein [Rickettsiales bacterium]|nr:Smr/MutS family protein [Rickettsiales bacterium]
MTRHIRFLSDEEERLWQQLQSTVTPLEPSNPLAIPALPAVSKAVKIKSVLRPPKPVLPAAPLQPLAQGSYDNMDRMTARKLKRGQYPVDAMLDLHGYNRERAQTLLEQFVSGHYQQGHRCVLVITGKGKPEAPAVLKTLLPQWLEQDVLRPMVLAFDTAKPHHGGAGAFYILLRRKRG